MRIVSKQTRANRRNAKKSTGPKTEEGKRTAKQNAIKHGLESETGLCHIEIHASKVNARLNLEVADNGPGFDGELAEMTSKGYGLANIIMRLEQLYGANHKFELGRSQPKGLRVSIEIPYQLKPGSAELKDNDG